MPRRPPGGSLIGVLPVADGGTGEQTVPDVQKRFGIVTSFDRMPTLKDFDDPNAAGVYFVDDDTLNSPISGITGFAIVRHGEDIVLGIDGSEWLRQHDFRFTGSWASIASTTTPPTVSNVDKMADGLGRFTSHPTGAPGTIADGLLLRQDNHLALVVDAPGSNPLYYHRPVIEPDVPVPTSKLHGVGIKSGKAYLASDDHSGTFASGNLTRSGFSNPLYSYTKHSNEILLGPIYNLNGNISSSVVLNGEVYRTLDAFTELRFQLRCNSTNGTTLNLYYKDGSDPTSPTDGTLVTQTITWGSNHYFQGDSGTLTNVPAGRRFWYGNSSTHDVSNGVLQITGAYSRHRCYIVNLATKTVTSFAPATDNADPQGVDILDDKLHILDGADKKTYAYTLTGARSASDDKTLTGLSLEPRGLAFTEDRTLVGEGYLKKIMFWDHAGVRKATEDIDLAEANESPNGLAVLDDAVSVVNWGNLKKASFDSGDQTRELTTYGFIEMNQTDAVWGQDIDLDGLIEGVEAFDGFIYRTLVPMQHLSARLKSNFQANETLKLYYKDSLPSSVTDGTEWASHNVNAGDFDQTDELEDAPSGRYFWWTVTNSARLNTSITVQITGKYKYEESGRLSKVFVYGLSDRAHQATKDWNIKGSVDRPTGIAFEQIGTEDYALIVDRTNQKLVLYNEVNGQGVIPDWEGNSYHDLPAKMKMRGPVSDPASATPGVYALVEGEFNDEGPDYPNGDKYQARFVHRNSAGTLLTLWWQRGAAVYKTSRSIAGANGSWVNSTVGKESLDTHRLPEVHDLRVTQAGELARFKSTAADIPTSPTGITGGMVFDDGGFQYAIATATSNTVSPQAVLGKRFWRKEASGWTDWSAKSTPTLTTIAAESAATVNTAYKVAKGDVFPATGVYVKTSFNSVTWAFIVAGREHWTKKGTGSWVRYNYQDGPMYGSLSQVPIPGSALIDYGEDSSALSEIVISTASAQTRYTYDLTDYEKSQARTFTSRFGTWNAFTVSDSQVPGTAGEIHFVPASGVAGSANSITLTPSPAALAYNIGAMWAFYAEHDSTGPLDVNVSGLGAKDIYIGKAHAGNGDIKNGCLYILAYDGTNMIIVAGPLSRIGTLTADEDDYGKHAVVDQFGHPKWNDQPIYLLKEHVDYKKVVQGVADDIAGATFDDDGALYMADSVDKKVYREEANGTQTNWTFGTGYNESDTAYTAQGAAFWPSTGGAARRIIVAYSHASQAVIQKYQLAGTVDGSAVNLASGNSDPRGIVWVPETSRFYVPDNDGFIYVYNSSFVEQSTEKITLPTPLSDPQAIEWDGNYLRVLDGTKKRLYAIKTDGTHDTARVMPLPSTSTLGASLKGMAFERPFFYLYENTGMRAFAEAQIGGPPPAPHGTLRRLKNAQSIALTNAHIGSEGEISGLTASINPSRVGAIIFCKGILSGSRDAGSSNLASIILRKKVGTGSYEGIHDEGDYTVCDKWNDVNSAYLDWETEVAHFEHWFVAKSTDQHKINVGAIPYHISGGSPVKSTSGTVYFNRPAAGTGALFDGKMYSELCVYELLPGGTMKQEVITSRDLP